MGESLKGDTSTRDFSRGEESLAGESYAPDECRSWALPKLMMAAEKMQLADEYEEAEELYQTIATYLEKGSDEMATLQDRMGCLFVRTGRLVEAMKCFRKALSIKKLRSPHSSSVAKTMGNIASVYCGKVSLFIVTTQWFRPLCICAWPFLNNTQTPHTGQVLQSSSNSRRLFGYPREEESRLSEIRKSARKHGCGLQSL